MIRVFLLATVSVLTVLITGCSASDDPSAPMMGNSDVAAMATPAPAVCANHEQGCPCDAPGDLIDCGRVKRQAGDYVWCSTGMQTCSPDGVWGKCTGDAAATGTTAP